MRIQSSLGMPQQQQHVVESTTNKTSSSTSQTSNPTKDKTSMLSLFRTSISKGASAVKQQVLAISASIKKLSIFSTKKSQNEQNSGVKSHLSTLETPERNTRHNNTTGPYPSEPDTSSNETVYATIVHPSKPLNPNRAGIPLPPIPTSPHSSNEVIYAELDFTVNSGSSFGRNNEPIYQNTQQLEPNPEPIYEEIQSKNIHD